MSSSEPRILFPKTSGDNRGLEDVTPALVDKKTFHTVVEREVLAASENGRPLSLLFIDVNHFKDINDTHGHLIGDVVIEELSEIVGLVVDNFRTEQLDGQERKSDLLTVSPARPPEVKSGDLDIDTRAGRLGGDEFGALCETNEEGAQIIAHRLRQAFADFLERPEAQLLKKLGIGLAVGTATLKQGMDHFALLHEADEAMYADKFSQLPPLTDDQKQFILDVKERMDKENIRLRDLGKYLLILTEQSS